VIGRHVVGVPEGFARDRYQLPIEEALSDPIRVPVIFVPVVGPERSIENRSELSLGVLGTEIFVSIRGHLLIPVLLISVVSRRRKTWWFGSSRRAARGTGHERRLAHVPANRPDHSSG
jgi:hypothetical protein